MQPLTPTERRKVEEIKSHVLNSRCENVYFETFDHEGDLVYVDTLAGKELWLKVLTMALKCNEVLQKEWNKNPTGRQAI